LKKVQKNIVLLTPGFPQNENDSTTIPALQIYVKALRERCPSLDIYVITFQYPFKSEYYQWFGVKVFPLNGQNKIYNKLFIWHRAKQLLSRLNRKNKIAVIHSFWLGECALVGRYFAKKNKIKHLITAMGQDVLKGNKYLHFLKKNCIVTLSTKQSDILLKNYDLKSILIPWGLNTNKITVQQNKTIDILGVGSLNKVKNFSLFIEIIAQLNTQISDLKVEIIGDGTLKKVLIKQISDKNLNNIIRLKGQLTREDVYEQMAQSKILLHTSYYESFGMVFLEAMSTGMQIVSFDVGISKNSDNWKVCSDKNAMIVHLLNLLKTKTNVCENNPYSIDKTIDNYRKLYDA